MQYCRTCSFCDSSKHGVQTAMIIMKPTTCRVHSVLFSYVENSKNCGGARRKLNVFYFSLQIFPGTFSTHVKFGWVSRRNARRSAISFDYCCLNFTWSVCGQILVQRPNLNFLENVSTVVDLYMWSSKQMDMTRLIGAF